MNNWQKREARLARSYGSTTGTDFIKARKRVRGIIRRLTEGASV